MWLQHVWVFVSFLILHSCWTVLLRLISGMESLRTSPQPRRDQSCFQAGVARASIASEQLWEHQEETAFAMEDYCLRATRGFGMIRVCVCSAVLHPNTTVKGQVSQGALGSGGSIPLTLFSYQWLHAILFLLQTCFQRRLCSDSHQSVKYLQGVRKIILFRKILRKRT